jgi:hypothetical protein
VVDEFVKQSMAEQARLEAVVVVCQMNIVDQCLAVRQAGWQQDWRHGWRNSMEMTFATYQLHIKSSAQDQREKSGEAGGERSHKASKGLSMRIFYIGSFCSMPSF